MNSSDIHIAYDGSVEDQIAYMKRVVPVSFHCLIDPKSGIARTMRDVHDKRKASLVSKAVSVYLDCVGRVAHGEEPLDIERIRSSLSMAAGSFTRKRQAATYLGGHVPTHERGF